VKTICIDAGNSLVKVAVMENSILRSLAAFVLTDTCALMRHIASLPPAYACILSSVSIAGQEIMELLLQKAPYLMELTADTPVPIRNLYKTPETLGKDRLAAVVGAFSLFPHRDILVLDAGTALTIDFIDSEGNYRGGNISPGLDIRFRALHDYTRKLPLLTRTSDFETIGDTTESAIISGVQNGIIFEINSYIHRFLHQFPKLITVLTGGDELFFADKLEKTIFAEPNLVYIGLEKIVTFNIK
jgi:type III pantothenate kinase